MGHLSIPNMCFLWDMWSQAATAFRTASHAASTGSVKISGCLGDVFRTANAKELAHHLLHCGAVYAQVVRSVQDFLKSAIISCVLWTFWDTLLPLPHCSWRDWLPWCRRWGLMGHGLAAWTAASKPLLMMGWKLLLLGHSGSCPWVFWAGFCKQTVFSSQPREGK